MLFSTIIIYGAGGHGEVVADAARSQGWQSIVFADDNPQKKGLELVGCKVVATGFQEVIDVCNRQKSAVALAIGDNRTRAKIFKIFVKAGVQMASVIHSSACVAPGVVIGVGTVVFAGAIINVGSKIGNNVIINTSASIDHDNVIADHVHVSPGVCTGGTVNVGEGSHLGLGSVVKNNIDVGKWSMTGAGAVVVKNIPDHVLAYGNPARVIRQIV